MTGIQFYMSLQGRTETDLVRLAHIPEAQIRRLMEDKHCQCPACLYMGVAAAMGLPVEALVEEHLEKDTVPKGLKWEESFDRKPNTRCRIYLAKIVGPHSEYRYDRAFKHLNYAYSAEDICCSIEDLEDGVYEVSAQWRDETTSELLFKTRSWFSVVDGVACQLEEHEVLDAVILLNPQICEGENS